MIKNEVEINKIYIDKLINYSIQDLTDKIANREAIMLVNSEKMNAEKYKELDNWKEELNNLKSGKIDKSMIQKAKDMEINDLQEKIKNREAMIISYSENMNPEKYEELKKWKERLDNLINYEIEESSEKINEDQREEELERDDEKNTLLDLPKLNLNLNMKTGECKLNGDEQVTEIDSRFYEKRGLRALKKCILISHEIADEDKKYLENVDPTIYNAYLKYDQNNTGKYKESAAELYVRSVINQSKKLEDEKNIDDNVKMPGNITIDLGYHPTQKNKRDKESKFGLKGLIKRFRAIRLLKFQGPKNMNLATIKDNRMRSRLAALLGVGTLTIGAVSLSNNNDRKTSEPENSIEIEDKNSTLDEEKEDTNTPIQAPINTNDEKTENIDENTVQKEADRIYLGDIVSPEQYSAIYKSADSEIASGALGKYDEKLGVNKIACVIDGKTYSTKNYSSDEIYEMAEKANVEVKYHLDQAIVVDGKNCVQVMEKQNPSPIYVYRDHDGIMKYLDGKLFTGDIESGIGWINSKDCEKSQLAVKKENIKIDKNISQNELER